jgi:hypothetical protein
MANEQLALVMVADHPNSRRSDWWRGPLDREAGLILSAAQHL